VTARRHSLELVGSFRHPPEGAVVAGEIDSGTPMTVTLHFRRRTPAPLPGSAEDLERLMRPMSHGALRRQRVRTHARAAARIAAFAGARGIAVRDIDLQAPAGVLLQTFGATVRLYQHAGVAFRARTGMLHIPSEIAPWTRAVVGFDERPLLRAAANKAAAGLWPAEVAALYGIPVDRDVSHLCAGIIAMGGGYQPEDLAAAVAGMGRKPPIVIDQSVAGVGNQFGGKRDRGQQFEKA
jgi:kumamolisin